MRPGADDQVLGRTSSIEPTEDSTGFGDNEAGSRVIPEVNSAFVVRVNAAFGNKTQIKTAGTKPSKVTDEGQQGCRYPRLRSSALLGVAVARGHQGTLELDRIIHS